MKNQIKEMARISCPCNEGGICCVDKKACDLDCSEGMELGKLYNAGYRKASDVVREIFEEIEEMLNMQAKIVCKTRETARDADEPMLSFIAMLDGRIYSLRVVEEHIAELKKKYIGEDKNVTTKESEGGE